MFQWTWWMWLLFAAACGVYVAAVTMRAIGHPL
jgi:hypothetical protein